MASQGSGMLHFALTSSLLLLTLACLGTDAACIFKRECTLGYDNPNNIPEESYDICDSGSSSQSLELPTDPVTGNYTNWFYCAYYWSVIPSEIVVYDFNMFNTQVGDILYVFLGSYAFAHEGGSVALFPNEFPGNPFNNPSVTMYFLSNGAGVDAGFDGNLIPSFPYGSRKRRRRSVKQVAEPNAPKKQSTTYLGQIEDESVIPQLGELLRHWKAGRISSGDLCDHSCSARRLQRMEACCKYWYENDITPLKCNGDEHAAQLPSGGICSAEHPLDRELRQKKKQYRKTKSNHKHHDDKNVSQRQQSVRNVHNTIRARWARTRSGRI